MSTVCALTRFTSTSLKKLCNWGYCSLYNCHYTMIFQVQGRHHAVFSCSCIIYYTTNNSRNHEYNNQECIRTKKEEERVTSQNLNRAKFLSRTKNSNTQSRVNWKCLNQKCKIYPWYAQNLLLDAWTFNVYVIIVLWFCTWPDLDVVSIVQNSALYTNVYESYRLFLSLH